MTIDAPWPFDRMPGVERLAAEARPSNLTLFSASNRSVGVHDLRANARNVWSPAPSEPVIGLTFARSDGSVADWIVDAAAAEGATIDVDWLTHTPPRGISDARFDRVTATPRLSHLAVAKTTIDDADIERLLAIPTLASLLLRGPVNDEQLDRLLTHRSLSWLAVHSTRLTPAAIEAAEASSGIAEVDLASPWFPPGVGKPLPTLDAFGVRLLDSADHQPSGVNQPRVRLFDLFHGTGPLSTSQSPTYFTVPDGMTDVPGNLPAIADRHADVERLDLRGDDRAGWFPLLGRLPVLRHAIVEVGSETDRAALHGHLAAARSLESLAVVELQHRRRPRPLDRLAWLPTMPTLRRLVIGEQPVDPAALAALADFPVLRRLAIDALADAGDPSPHDLTWLDGHDGWEMLLVPNLRVDDAGLARIASLPTLTRLHVDGLHVTAMSEPVIADLLDRGVHVTLARPDIPFAVLDRLEARARVSQATLEVVSSDFSVGHAAAHWILDDVPDFPR